MPIQFNEPPYELGLPKKMSPPPNHFVKMSKKAAAANSQYINCDPILSIDGDEPFALPIPNACNEVPQAPPIVLQDCDGDCEAEAPASAHPWHMGSCEPAGAVLKGLFVFHVHVGQAPPDKAIDLMKMVQSRYKSTEIRLKENGYEVMWLPTRTDSRSEFFPTT